MKNGCMKPTIYRHSMLRRYSANSNGIGYSTGDYITKSLSCDSGAGAEKIGPAVWTNVTTQEIIKPAPLAADLDLL